MPFRIEVCDVSAQYIEKGAPDIGIAYLDGDTDAGALKGALRNAPGPFRRQQTVPANVIKGLHLRRVRCSQSHRL